MKPTKRQTCNNCNWFLWKANNGFGWCDETQQFMYDYEWCIGWCNDLEEDEDEND